MKSSISFHSSACYIWLQTPIVYSNCSTGHSLPAAAAVAAPGPQTAQPAAAKSAPPKPDLWRRGGPIEPIPVETERHVPRLNFEQHSHDPLANWETNGKDLEIEEVFFKLFYPQKNLDDSIAATNAGLPESAHIDADQYWQFLALTLLIGLNRRDSREENWKIRIPGDVVFGDVMSFARYNQILSAFRLCAFDDAEVQVCLVSFLLKSGK